ncbi:hypothetical protein TL16_g09413 [Triparma laevis f. inornata]|uniref:peptidylprolyl isomerase n=1 Tax=Triparma laevis f. inornata TaxID=1714386 RepID=A0A9W7B9S0_9STRA|nr:hypothetical protein TL16_g09413 [Triparma laevis f. inornata]
MIEPLRYRSLTTETKYQQMKKFPRCLSCHREGRLTPSIFLCVDCKMKCYCLECDVLNHAGPKKAMHKRKRITIGKPYKVQVLGDGDGFTFPKTHDWVELNYKLYVKEKELEDQNISKGAKLLRNTIKCLTGTRQHKYGNLVDTTFGYFRKPLMFQAGCSGPCIHLQVKGCKDVAALDDNGMSDPYVAVWWKDTLIGTTRVMHKTLHPEWENETFVIPLEKDFVKVLNGKEKSLFIANKNKGKEHHHHDPNIWRPGMPLSQEDSGKIIEELNGANEMAKLPKLRLDVFDYDKFSKNDFLGQKTFSDNEMLQVLFEHQEEKLRDFHLEPKKARGVLGIKLAMTKDEAKGTSTLILQITDGKNLPKADPWSLSDPYCTISWNGESIGKTKIVKSTLDPIWRHMYFEVKLTPGEEDKEIDEGELLIEVWDWDRVGSDDQLGVLTFKGKEMKDLMKKSDETAELGLDDDVLRVIEGEWKRLEGTPKLSDFKIKVLHKIDLEAQAEREHLKDEHEAEKMRLLQEKIDAGLETAEERKLRKTMEKNKRRKERATARAAKKQLKKELRRRGMKSMADRASRETRDTRATQGDSLSALLASAKAEVDEEIEKGVDFETEYKTPAVIQEDEANLDGDGSLDSRGLRKTRGTARGSRASRRSRRSSQGKQNRRGSLMNELTPEQLANLAENPELLLKQIKDGELELDKNDMEEDDGSIEEEDRDSLAGSVASLEEEDSLAYEGYEKGVCTAYNNVLGLQIIFEDDDGFEIVKREEWITLADAPLNVKIGKNEELEEVWKKIEIQKAPVWKKIFVGHAKIAAEIDQKKQTELGWMDKMMGRKNLGLKTYYPLYLPDSESGAAHIKGHIEVRMVYHTRGAVLRGIDEVVTNMCLGERCLIDVRADYAFGEAYGDFNVPPHSDLSVEVDLVGVRGLGGIYLFISRNTNFVLHKFWLVLQLLIIIWEFLICHYKKLLCPLWCKAPWVKQKRFDIEEDEEDDFDEDAMLADESLQKLEEGSSEVKEEEEEEAKNESTLGAKLLFAKF